MQFEKWGNDLALPYEQVTVNGAIYLKSTTVATLSLTPECVEEHSCASGTYRRIKRESLGFRKLSDDLSPRLMGRRYLGDSTKLLSVIKHFICCYLVDPIVGDTGLYNVLVNTRGELAAIDWEESRGSVREQPGDLLDLILSKRPEKSTASQLLNLVLENADALLQFTQSLTDASEEKVARITQLLQ
jgi:hypothetical protein